MRRVNVKTNGTS